MTGWRQALARDGFACFPVDPDTLRWARAAHREGCAVLSAAADQIACQGTWFVGVDALSNGPDGRIAGIPLAGAAITALAPLPALHKAQLSVTFPGYPRPRDGEGKAAFRYRLLRDGAHVDGLLPIGPDRQRQLREPHGFILGLPLVATDPGASPLVVWRGSHALIRAAFADVLFPLTESQRPFADLTAVYATTRRRVFELCERVEIHLPPGAAIVLDPAVLHGIAPWQAGAGAPPEGRMIAYFRPLHPQGHAGWLGENPT
ncbi:hypothetical protein VK792_19320 [Mesobacterium sp. TK19101]|uniref:Phytanoyl-CoA dioxygenase n=1 Tax=Mesobacterium hydrothermale TaxID=3111907 RepID=A0ABU6HNL5_9RHOB|nr:hypothetical protein [Mesobacterium sp. TK19101]MEC3863436.1 hypothetical protein [Mesobacterium sp. TK19101]